MQIEMESECPQFCLDGMCGHDLFRVYGVSRFLLREGNLASVEKFGTGRRNRTTCSVSQATFVKHGRGHPALQSEHTTLVILEILLYRRSPNPRDAGQIYVIFDAEGKIIFARRTADKTNQVCEGGCRGGGWSITVHFLQLVLPHGSS